MLPELGTYLKKKIGEVWCDASSIVTGVVVEIGSLVAEDATWLRGKKMIIIILTWLS